MHLDIQKIAMLLAEQGLTYQQLAKRADVSPQTVSTINTRRTCKPLTAGKLARALQVKIQDIIIQEEVPTDARG